MPLDLVLLMIDRYQMGQWNKGGFDGFADVGYKWAELLLRWIDGLLKWW